MEWFIKALSKYAIFKGRSRRTEYWMFQLFYTLGLVTIVMIGSFLDILSPLEEAEWADLISNIYILGLFLPALAVSIRRMHDVDKSGFFILIPIYRFILFCTKGTTGENKYGTDPIEEDDDDDEYDEYDENDDEYEYVYEEVKHTDSES